MIPSLTRSVLTKRLTIDGTNYILAAGTSDVNSNSFAIDGYESFRFLALLGAIVATGAVEFQVQGSDDDSNWSDLEGSSVSVTDADDNKAVIIEVIQPRHRYHRLQTIRGDAANSTIDGLLVELAGARVEPVTKDATVLTQEIHHSPAAGTA